MKIPLEYYVRPDVVEVARDLLGKSLYTRMNGHLTVGIITQTEAYAGETDRASHAWNGRYTRRTRVMYQEGGVAYVYLCYGIHSLFNIVTNREGIPHAVLVRAVFATHGLEAIYQRIGGARPVKHMGNGPGKLTRMLGIHYSHSGMPLTGDILWLEDHGLNVRKDDILVTPRIGVDYAGEDALLPYRFVVAPESLDIKKAGAE